MADGEREPTARFSTRVGYYVRHRPGYPTAVLDLLRETCGLVSGSRVADVGSGTGKLTKLLLDAGYAVDAVEPNAEMRAAAEDRLGERRGFTSVAGSAEATGLAASSVEAIAVAQAFHWFRVEPTRREFARILRPDGWVVLIWNRRTERSPILLDYEELLRRLAIDYTEVDHRKTTDGGVLPGFFRGTLRRTTFPYRQVLDWDGLRGRALSSSYVPLPGQPRHRRLMRRLREIFDAHQQEGAVTFEYETEVFWGRVV